MHCLVWQTSQLPNLLGRERHIPYKSQWPVSLFGRQQQINNLLDTKKLGKLSWKSAEPWRFQDQSGVKHSQLFSHKAQTRTIWAACCQSCANEYGMPDHEVRFCSTDLVSQNSDTCPLHDFLSEC